MHVMLRPRATLIHTQIHSTPRMLSKKIKTTCLSWKKTKDNCLSYFIILNCGRDSLYKFCNHQWKPPFQNRCPGAYTHQEGAWQEHGSPGGCAHTFRVDNRGPSGHANVQSTGSIQEHIQLALHSLASTWHQLASSFWPAWWEQSSVSLWF